MHNQLDALLKQALQKNNLVIADAMQQKLLHYLNLLTTWNKVFNLTTITTPKEMVYLHLIDSLVIAPFVEGNRCLDVGSGAGLPGIPLAIIHPEQEWVLLDKNSKKTRFLTQASAELGLKNVRSVHSRSEDFHTTPCFDNILSRALGTLHMFIETTQHLLCEKGSYIAMKGKYPQEELDDIPSGFMAKSITRLQINGMDIDRHIVCLVRNN